VNPTFAQESSAKSEPNDCKMQWFGDARLGIFIHWGIYAVNGIDESWSFFNGYISHEDYLKQLDGFTARNYDPEKWVDLIKESGAKYAVLTTKHHDGVALWDTQLGNLNVVDDTPAGRDLVEPFVKAMRKKGLKAGLYYSLPDWSYKDYPNKTRTEIRYDADEVRWRKFLNITCAHHIGTKRKNGGKFPLVFLKSGKHFRSYSGRINDRRTGRKHRINRTRKRNPATYCRRKKFKRNWRNAFPEFENS